MSKIECAIIEYLIAIRLGAQFFVQLISVILTGSVDEETFVTKGFRYILIVGTCLATYIVIRKKVYTVIKRQHLYYMLFLLLYVGLMYYYLFIDSTRTYYGIEAKTKFSTTANNVLFLSVVSTAFVSPRINSFLICKIIVVLALLSCYLYLSYWGIGFGESYNGFLLQDSGFSSLQVGYFSGMNLLFTLYLHNRWSSKTWINRIVTLFLATNFAYVIIISGKTGPTIFCFLVALIACKQIFIPKISMKAFIILLVALLLIGSVFLEQILSLINSFNPNLALKISNTILKGDTSNRDFLFDEALRVFSNNILFGSYFELKRYGIYPHNFFLENFITWGLAGTLIMVFFLWKACKISFKLIMQDSQLTWVVYLFVFAFLSAQSTGSLYGNYRFWLGLTILITISNIKYGKTIS